MKLSKALDGNYLTFKYNDNEIPKKVSLDIKYQISRFLVSLLLLFFS